MWKSGVKWRRSAATRNDVVALNILMDRWFILNWIKSVKETSGGRFSWFCKRTNCHQDGKFTQQNVNKQLWQVWQFWLCRNLMFFLQMQFMLLFSRQGKLRLQKWYVPHPDKLKKKITRELITTILARKPKMSSFLEWKDVKVVYKRWLLIFLFLYFVLVSWY